MIGHASAPYCSLMFRKMKGSYFYEEREIFVLPLKKLLCPTDFSEPSREALKVAVEFASHFGAQLSLVNVVPLLPVLPRDPNYAFKVPEYEQMLHADAEERLNELVGEVTTPGKKIRKVVGRGDEDSELVFREIDRRHDVIVIATHGMTGWRRAVFGSVAERVVRLAKCPVLTTRVSQAEP